MSLEELETRLGAVLPDALERTVANPPSISLVTPNFNSADYIEATLQSVLQQSYPNLEYGVIDGDSNDGSQSIIEKYRDQLAFYVTEPDHGHADAINKGFEQTSGEIMGWINSDDLLLPGSLNAIGEFFAKYPEVQWVTGHPSAVYPNGTWKLHALRNWSRLRFLNGDYRWIQQESTFWRRSLWERAGGQVANRMNLAVDLELWTRFFRHAELFTYAHPIAAFRYRAGQRSELHRSAYEAEALSVIQDELAGLDGKFRDLFKHVLPQKVVPLEVPLSPEKDSALSICDTPLIQSEDVAARDEPIVGPDYFATLRDKADQLATVPSPLNRFKGQHLGERCFIMGNGPSLNKMDLNLLRDEIVFGCNSIFLLFDRIDWRPRYYACVDARVLPDRAEDITRMLNENASMEAFFPYEIKPHTGAEAAMSTRKLIPPANGRFYFRERYNVVSDDPFTMFSADIDSYIVQPYTVAITMLQIAVYMGFKDIYLIGCDTHYKIADGVLRESGNSLALTSTSDSDPNHFDPRYFGQNRKWHDPQTDKMIEHHIFAHQACQHLGARVFNATVGGKLEVYPRVEYEELFQ